MVGGRPGCVGRECEIGARQAGVRGARFYKRLGRSPERGNISERINGASGVNLAGIVVQPF